MPELNISLLRMAERYEPIDNAMVVPAAVGQGTPVYNVRGRTLHTVFVSGLGTATLQVMASVDNVNFFPVGQQITANGVYTIQGSFEALRVDVTAYTSGTPQVIIRSQLA
ncbi:MAG: hypothetical protein ACPL5F_01380 [Moorellaceae bacterium]